MKLTTGFLLLLVGSSLHANEIPDVAGVIRSVHKDDLKITLEHQGIKNHAEAPGSLEVYVSGGDHAIAKVGRRIRGTLVTGSGGARLQRIWPADEATERSLMLVNRDLTRPRIGVTGKSRLSIGDELPRFAMYNQLGDLITAESWSGKLVVLNFIFTRGSVPSMSPATTQQMVELQARLKGGGYEESVRLISISLDPEYDTPGVCYTYLEDMGADHSTYWLLTGSPKVLGFLTQQIGLVATPSEKTIINHSMVTIVADRDGKIFYRRPGSRWDVGDIYDRLEVLLTSWR